MSNYHIMDDAIYKDMLEKAKADYIASQQKLGAHAREIELLEERISGLRETIFALSRMLRAEPFEEADALGLTDAIRQAYRTHGGPLVPTDVRARLESMGYDTGKYGNLMASVHSIIGRLEKRGEIRSSGTIGGKPAHAWVPKTLIEQFGQGVAEGMAGAAGESPYGALAGIAEQMSDINKESASLAIAAEERKKAKKP
jgi:hypothetical protein